MATPVLTKSRIDKAGKVLSAPLEELTEEYLALEDVFADFRVSHLAPLTRLTSELQSSLDRLGISYYIAQRLKRRPQIIRKLSRLSVRLTQLQDIGGLRIIVDETEQADKVAAAVDEYLRQSANFSAYRTTDYRPAGRDDSGYRALHKIALFDKRYFEIQIRTRAQHYWSESIERTSVFYGKRLKEGDGSSVVLLYFKKLSDVFFAIENAAKPSLGTLSDLTTLQLKSEEIIRRDGYAQLMDGVVNEDVVRTLIETEKANPSRVNNWVLVFDWRTATFVTWEIVSRDPEKAVETYSRYEQDFPEQNYYEVVLIGSSDVATVRKTHSHYFGLQSPDKVLEDLGQSVVRIADDIELDRGSKSVLSRLAKRKVWGEAHGIQRQTLKNHFCKDVDRFDESVDFLVKMGYLIDKGGAGVSLNVARTADIEKVI